MSVAVPPVTLPPSSVEPATSIAARTLASIAPSNASASHSATPTFRLNRTTSHGRSPPTMAESSIAPRSNGEDSKRSPTTNRSAPKIIVKKEPTSPDIGTARHRPRRLDLSGPAHNPGPGRPSAPLTGKESAGLALQDVGLHCLSPGFHTQDPSMREQLQRSIDVRERQRQIIEARAKGQKEPEGPVTANPFRNSNVNSGLKTPATSRRKGPPPMLSIAPPSAQQFANERVVQTAPINSTFTGLQRPTLIPTSRQHQSTNNIHHVPANQTTNRLPPIADVFPDEIPGSSHGPRTAFNINRSPGHSSHSNIPPPLPSPGFPHQQSNPPQRPREYKSAEEALQSLSGGREELLPRLVHYGGHQPPTPPSPMPKHNTSHPTGMHTQYATATPAGSHTIGLPPSGDGLHRTTSARRRGRDEYERDMGTPPLRRERTGPFGEGRDTPETMRRKKEEFIMLCGRAWDLFHS